MHHLALVEAPIAAVGLTPGGTMIAENVCLENRSNHNRRRYRAGFSVVSGKVVLRRQLKRRHVLPFFQKLPSDRLVSGPVSSHYWSRKLQALDHPVRLMHPLASNLT
jgi:hypothetical protein